MSSPMKARGVGELGLCDVGARSRTPRLRDYPLTLDKLIDRLPPIA